MTNSRPKSRPRERTTKPRSRTRTTTLSLNILSGPWRSEIYHESEFCFDGISGGSFRIKFLLENSPFAGCYLKAQISGMQHCDDEPYLLKLSGKVNACFISAKKYGIYPFTAAYNALHCCGTIRIEVPLADLPNEQQMSIILSNPDRP